MDRALIKTCVFFLACVVAFAALCPSAAGQSKTEMKILRMYYREKDLVVSATRHPKSISYIAENMAIVTAKEIEAMNAHTVAEILNRVPGLFVNFNQDFGAASLLSIQGSEERHVLVLVDGVPWNFLASGAAETHSIPVAIIERIEIIKGPASSAWGSSLGGVINIITRQPENNKSPTGSIRASYGESNTRDYRAQLSGRTGSLGYYLFAGRQDSDGLTGSRYFENNSLYSKFKIPVSKDVNAGLTMGYSEPRIKIGNFSSEDITQTGDSRTFFSTASLDASLARDLNVNISLHHFKQKSILENRALGLGVKGYQGEPYLDTIYDEKTTGGGGKLVWEKGRHTIVLGADFDRGSLDQTLYAGSFLQSMGVPETSCTHPAMETWAVFANDTLVINRWSVTPGIRYDRNSITGSFLSPSLGVTFQLGEDSILRASAARGFTTPPLTSTSGGGLFLDPNPSLKPEKVWSFQAGAETSAARYLWLKATCFRHELKNALSRDLYGAGAPTFNDLYKNQGKIRRQGFEIEAETIPFYNVTLLGGAAYVRIKPSDESDTNEKYTYNIGVRYDDKKSFQAQLFGHYIWWDLEKFYQASYDDFIWDLHLTKRIYAKAKNTMEIFVAARNIFNGDQYTLGDSMNPGRWIEIGIRMNL